jgi:hypothetical protein
MNHNTKEGLCKIRNKGMDYKSFLTNLNIKGNILTINSMVKVSLRLQIITIKDGLKKEGLMDMDFKEQHNMNILEIFKKVKNMEKELLKQQMEFK